jgi:hypothetical protein
VAFGLVVMAGTPEPVVNRIGTALQAWRFGEAASAF